MCKKRIFILRFTFVVLVFATPISDVIAETLYVDIKTGSDTNPGTKEKPLSTLQQAAILV